MAHLRTTLATSAGGVVVSADPDRPALVVGMRRRRHDSVTWTLPKGTPDPGETIEETALREVTEETGLQVRILEPLRAIEYAFVQDGTRIHKTVHHYLLEAAGGELSDADLEVDEVAWVPLGELAARLAYAGERRLAETAAGLLADTA